MKAGIIGSGYVGLTTAVCLASLGHEIIIYDIDKKKIQLIKEKKIPFFEPQLQDLFENVTSNGNLSTSDTVKDLIENTDGCFICVGTPSRNNGSIDLSQIKNTIESISSVINEIGKDDYVIIIRSTIIPNTTKNVILPHLNKLVKKQISVCIIPEFLREGNAVSDFMNPDKIVIGYNNEKGKNFAHQIFEKLKGKGIIIETNHETAEMIKYTNNSFFSTLISFSNEIANISEQVTGIDAYEVLKALVADRRITSNFNNEKIIPELVSYLIPGCGFGGSCFPKDIKAIINYADSVGTSTPLLKSVMKINDERPTKVITLAESILGSLEEKWISLLGLAFKPDTDDLRSSPSIEALKILQKKNAHISVYDPMIDEKKLLNHGIKGIKTCNSIEECLEKSDLAIIFTKWPQFKKIDSQMLNKNMKNPKIIDGRGFLNEHSFKKNEYFKIGYKL